MILRFSNTIAMKDTTETFYKLMKMGSAQSSNRYKGKRVSFIDFTNEGGISLFFMDEGTISGKGNIAKKNRFPLDIKY